MKQLRCHYPSFVDAIHDLIWHTRCHGVASTKHSRAIALEAKRVEAYTQALFSESKAARRAWIDRAQKLRREVLDCMVELYQDGWAAAAALQRELVEHFRHSARRPLSPSFAVPAHKIAAVAEAPPAVC